MSNISILADKLRSGTTVLAAWCGLPDSSVTGVLTREGFDAITIDMQHGAIDFAATV